MRHFKHYCKLIFSTIAVVLVFACYSFTAYADPLTAAMIAGGLADGFVFSGLTGLSPDSIASLTDVSYTDFIPWSDIVLAGKAYLTIRDLVGTNNVEVSLSPELSYSGYDRITQLNSAYGLTPGTVHSYGSLYALNGYIFYNKTRTTNTYAGYGLGNIQESNQVFSISSDVFLTSTFLTTDTRDYVSHIGQQVDTFANKYVPAARKRDQIVLSISPGNPSYLRWGYLSSDNIFNEFHYPGISSNLVSQNNPSIGRSNDSVITDPDGLSNKIVLPASYLQDISYTSGETINIEQTVIDVLNDILDAISENDVIESSYSDTPAPPSSETIAETPYTTLDDTFTEFKEFFGDIYDGITDFKESFGDWVNNVASGWTEVFGDIYSDLHDFKESFGDWVDDIASGWTEVFGDIYSTVSGIASTVSGTIANTLSGISSAIQSLVQTIENADFNFVDAFWKNFLTPFNNLFNTIKSHLSIWHYVVEWLASISSVFTFYLGVFSGAGSGFLLPIYACFAGTVVIAVYRRFGK